MKKISTLYQKDPNDLSRVIDKLNIENEWVINGDSIPTRKFDGTSVAVIEGELFKRYDCKIDKKTGKYKKPIPTGAIPCQEPDIKSGHHPHWVKCDRNNPADKYHFEAFDKLESSHSIEFKTFELCGPKIQGNPEGFYSHVLILHGASELNINDFSFEGLKQYLSNPDINIEGIVFHNKYDSRMCKIRKCDFGIDR